jgi:hypothetical protein
MARRNRGADIGSAPRPDDYDADRVMKTPNRDVKLGLKTKKRLALRSICVESMGEKDANAKDYKKCRNHFKKHVQP